MRTIKENREICSGKIKQWENLRTKFYSYVCDMSICHTRGYAVITVVSSKDEDKARNGYRLAEDIVNSKEFRSLNVDSFTIGVETPYHNPGSLYNLRIRAFF
jgi:hypothetical protein